MTVFARFFSLLTIPLVISVVATSCQVQPGRGKSASAAWNEETHVDAVRSAVSVWLGRTHPQANLVFFDRNPYPEILEDDYADLEFLCGRPGVKNYPLFEDRGKGQGRYVPLGVSLKYAASIDDTNRLAEAEVSQLKAGEISFATDTLYINQTMLVSEVEGHVIAVVISSPSLGPFSGRNVDQFIFHLTEGGLVLESVESGYT